MPHDLLLSALRDPDRGRRNLSALGAHLGPDSFQRLAEPLSQLLPRSPDPDMALNNLERYFASSQGAAPALLEQNGQGLEALLQLLGTSQFFADALVADPELFDMLRVPLRQSPSPDELRRQLQAEVDAAADDPGLLRAFRRFRRRQMLRIGTNDVIRDRPLEEVTRDLSDVADAALEIAVATAVQRIEQRFGQPVAASGRPARHVVLAFGKLGGQELNYSSDIDLMLLFDEEGATHGRGKGLGNDEFFARVVGDVVRLLSARTEDGYAYRVDLRLRPEGRRGPLARSLASALAYYDALGRTWERQALIKVRAVAGDMTLGAEFLRGIETFVYRKYLSFAEINEIKALKRQIEHKAHEAGVSRIEVKTGRGGIRDIEFTTQFLQLLNGGDLPALRQRNTLLALQALEVAGCLTATEARILDDAYRFLRRAEHRLQLLFDLQTHRLPERPEDLRKLALRMGYSQRESRSAERETSSKRAPRSFLDDAPLPQLDTRDLIVDPLDAFLHDYHDKTRLDRQILDHLLHQTFAGGSEEAEPESDLILDPDPEDATIRAVLGRYGFRDIPAAYRNLAQLAQESVPFLSTWRCRHFLASIAPALLRAVAATPDPDLALLNLEKVTASLGAKAVLWELFSLSPPSLKLTVELCAGSQFLTEILINAPGMIDELLDSLVLNQPRTLAELKSELAELCRGATDPVPILRSFQDKELLRIGVRDLLGKATIRETTEALSDVAETLLYQVVELELRARAPQTRERRHALVALGKLGGREMSYHSDLDLVLIHEDDRKSAPGENALFFTDLMQRIIRAMSLLGPVGRLYQVDMRLRPMGRSGVLVTPLAEFRRYHESGAAQLWERQVLTRARVVHGDAKFAEEVMAVAANAAFGREWKPEYGQEIVAMRERLEASCGPRDVKRGFGGQVDIEFLVQALQLKHGGELPQLRQTNTWEGLDALAAAGLLTEADHAGLRSAYDFLRQVESRLRITTNRALDEWPDSPPDLEKLARRRGFESSADFTAELQRQTQATRERFMRLMQL
jgi:glutamate-ammonia-ligase adenylyltransferase